MRSIQRLAVLVLLAASACAPAAPAPTQPQTTGGAAQPTEKRAAVQKLTVAQIGMGAAMTPEVGLSSSPYYMAMYDQLTMVNETFTVLPWVAEKWSQVNPTTWRFTIRKGLTFSNGDPLTAADVEFTGKLMIETKMPALGQFPNLTEVKLFDADNVDFVTKLPDASVVPAGAFLSIMPKKYYESVGKTGFATKPIGSGPYEIVDFKSSDMVSFKKRAAKHPFREAQVDQLIFRSITEQSQVLAGMKTGELDAFYGTLNPDRLETFKQAGIIVQAKNSGMVTALFSQTENQQRNSPLNDKRVRLAVNYAVDKEGIVKQILKGYGQPLGQLSTPNSPSWDDSLKPYPYDPATAKRLLAEAGYPNGVKLTAGIEFTPNVIDPTIVQAIQGNLKDVGIDAPINSFEFGQFLDKYYGRNGQSKGEMFITSASETNGFGTFLYSNYTCNKPLVWWCNPDFDKNMELAVGEPDSKKRAELLRKAVATFRDDTGLLFLYMPQTFVLLSPKLKGFVWPQDRFFVFDSTYVVE